MIKIFFKYFLVYVIAWGCTLFVVHGITHELMGHGIYQNFAIRALAFIAIGVGTGTSAIVYSFDRLKPWQQQVSHIFISFITLAAISFVLNWFHAHPPAIVIPIVLTITFSFFVFWMGFYIYKKHEAKQINAILEKRNKRN